MIIQYLLDADHPVKIPGVAAPEDGFNDIVAPVELALEQEKRVTEQINALAGHAREEGDYQGEQFMQWFIKEQVEEVATASDLLKVVERARTTRCSSRSTSRARRRRGGRGPDRAGAAGGALERPGAFPRRGRSGRARRRGGLRRSRGRGARRRPRRSGGKRRRDRRRGRARRPRAARELRAARLGRRARGTRPRRWPR